MIKTSLAFPRCKDGLSDKVRKGWNDLSKDLSSTTYPGINIDSDPTRIPVAELTVGLPGISVSDGAVALRWDDPASAAEAARLVTNAIGPTARAPESSMGVGLMLLRPEEVHAVRILLQCRTAPTEKDLQKFLPDAHPPRKAGSL